MRTDRMSLDEYRTLRGVSSTSRSGRIVAVEPPKPDEPKPSSKGNKAYALGRLKQGEMNGTETEYSAHLELLKAAGEIVWFKFEGVKFRLADNTFYTPDFAVMLASGQLQAHEVKGHWLDDARAKIKIAAAMYPIEFIAVTKANKKDGGGWKVEQF